MFKIIADCKVVTGESVTKQQRLVVCRISLLVQKRKMTRAEDQMVENEEGKLLCELQGGVKLSSERYRTATR